MGTAHGKIELNEDDVDWPVAYNVAVEQTTRRELRILYFMTVTGLQRLFNDS